MTAGRPARSRSANTASLSPSAVTAITAAVVGVIVNLAAFFAWHVLWPNATQAAPFSGGFEWFAALLSAAAFVALFRYKVGIIPVIGASAVAGLAWYLAMM